jgi:hypothetical protein
MQDHTVVKWITDGERGWEGVKNSTNLDFAALAEAASRA